MRCRLGGVVKNSSLLRRFPLIKEKREGKGEFRTFYDKIKHNEGKKDEGPGDLFEGFPRNPIQQKIPDSLREFNKTAIDKSENINFMFMIFIIFLMIGVALFIDPYRQDQFMRPYKEGMVSISYIGEKNARYD
ncbi:unnamed protein product [Phytomonas sp. Hart1]|nr:unnamed protein product [Phytomonas sp. Hart1]|eukprot:CCW71303.1 unnamed protein product [Phytomonas sp. isolate Hart1]